MKELFPKNSSSLVKKHLSQALYEKLKNKKTSSGYTLNHAIHSGVTNPDSDIGIYAGDAESYNTFSEIFDLIIADYHLFTQEKHHITDLSYCNLPPLDPENKYIISSVRNPWEWYLFHMQGAC